MGFKSLLLLMTLTCLLACNQQEKKLPDGWYQVDDRNRPTGNAIVTPVDFADLKLDSSAYTAGRQVYVITGRLKTDKVKNWAEATEKAIGNSLTFVFDGKVVVQPSVNARIDSGSFSIGLPPEKQDGEVIRQMFQRLSVEMKGEEVY